MNRLESIFLPGYSFGSENEYFFIKDLNGNTKLEADRGAIVSHHSDLYIPNESGVLKSGEHVFTLPCRINLSTFVCIVSTPDDREYLGVGERLVSVAAIRSEDLYGLSKASQIQNKYVFFQDKPKFDFQLTPANTRNVTSKFFSFEQSLEIFPGIIASVSFPWFDFLLFSSLLSIFVLTIFLCSVVGFDRWLLGQINREIEVSNLKNQNENHARVQKLVMGVIHDIKSPMSTLRFLAADEQSSDRKVIFELLIKRMRLILNDLEGKGAAGSLLEASQMPIKCVLKSIIQEKQKELGLRAKIALNLNGHNELWAFGVYSDFCRMLSNIINNSVQASVGRGRIEIEIKEDVEANSISLIVKDSGKGIPAEIIGSIFDEGMTFGKVGGTGFGLFHAKNVISKMGGDIQIESPLNSGTTVTITIPTHEPPSWYLEELIVSAKTKLVLIDDEKITREILAKKIQKFSPNLELTFFSAPNDVPLDVIADENSFFIVDNNFGAELSSGLLFCGELPPERTLLFTSDWNNKSIQIGAESLNIKLLGKEFVDHLVIAENAFK